MNKLIKRGFIAIEAVIIAAVCILGGMAGTSAFLKNGQSAQARAATAMNNAIEMIEEKFDFSVSPEELPGGEEIFKVETLAGTTWQFNEYIDNYEFLDVFDYENQSGWNEFPSGCRFLYNDYSYAVYGFTSTENPFGYGETFGGVQPADVNLAGVYIPDNFLGDNGWHLIDSEIVIRYMEGQIVDINEFLAGFYKVSAPIVIFSEISNEVLENKQLINWMYENATLQ